MSGTAQNVKLNQGSWVTLPFGFSSRVREGFAYVPQPNLLALTYIRQKDLAVNLLVCIKIPSRDRGLFGSIPFWKKHSQKSRHCNGFSAFKTANVPNWDAPDYSGYSVSPQ